jgi:DNA-binding NarL/FixJ family response regulator
MTNIILADSEAIFTAGIARILAVDENTQVVAQCSDSDQVHRALAEFPGSIVLFAPSLVTDLKRLFVRLEAFGSRGVVIADCKASPNAYLHQGFRGVVFRDVTSKALLDCVRRVAAGGIWQPPLPVDLTSPENDILGMQACNQLTSKQLRVVAYVVQGMRTEEIANRLNSTEPSIKTHLRSIYMKLRVSDRLDLAMFALRHPALMKALAGMRKSFDTQCQVAEKENEVA